MSIDKDDDGFFVPSKPGEVIPPNLLDLNDNDKNIKATPGATGASAGQTGTGTATGGDEFNTTIAGYVVYDPAKKQNINLNDNMALAKYLRTLSPATIKQYQQSLASLGRYDGPINGKVDPDNSLVYAVGKVLQNQEIRGVANEPITAGIKEMGTSTSAAGKDTAIRANVSSPAELNAEINKQFQDTFGENAPAEVKQAYFAELTALQKSRTTRTKKEKGVELSVYGVSAQERTNILNKYVKQFAAIRISAANAGDATAQALLTKGDFGVAYTSLKNAYSDNGMKFNAKVLADQALEGSLDPGKLKSNINLINLNAKTMFPALTQGIDSGYTVKQLLSPYLQTRANILEEDADTIDISSLTNIASKPGELMGLYDYEVSLRKDPKWKYTKNAQDTLSSVALRMAKTFGKVG